MNISAVQNVSPPPITPKKKGASPKNTDDLTAAFFGMSLNTPTQTESQPIPYYQEFYGYSGQFYTDNDRYKITPPANKKHHALADVGDSDADCSDAEAAGKHRVKKAMSAAETTVYSQKKRIKGDVLITKCQEWAQEAIRDAQTITLKKTKNGDYRIYSTDHWLASAGHMVVTPSKDMVSASFFENISVGRSGISLELKKTGNTERLHFPSTLLEEITGKTPTKTDLSCKEIATITTTRLTQKNYTDAQYATWQLERLKGNAGPKRERDQQWLDCMNAWMFGVEASRNNATFVTGVMTLELIADGQMTYQQALAENEYGGRFPMAVVDSGPGNMTARRKLIEHVQNGQPVGMKTDRMNPQWLAISLKEAVLIKNWLIYFNHADRSMSQKDILKKYETAVKTLLGTYFSD